MWQIIVSKLAVAGFQADQKRMPNITCLAAYKELDSWEVALVHACLVLGGFLLQAGSHEGGRVKTNNSGWTCRLRQRRGAQTPLPWLGFASIQLLHTGWRA